MFRDIPGSENWLDVIPVNAGWSGDEKFHVTDENGRAAGSHQSCGEI